MKTISVIVPVYNAEKFLNRCIDSIICQTFENLEIILVDDGSSDRSGQICDEYAGKDNRIKVIHKVNGGVSSARNCGLDCATGDYVAFVDSDDYISPFMYSKLFEAISDRDNSVALCDMMIHRKAGDVPASTLNPGRNKIETLRRLILSDVGSGSVYFLIPSIFLTNLRFPQHLQQSEDFWFVLRLLASVETLVKVPEPLYFYNRENEESLTHSLSFDTDIQSVRGYVENETFLKESGHYEHVKKEWSWSVLRFKSTFALSPSRLNMFREVLPDANNYINGCPLLSRKVQFIMHLLNLRLDCIVRLILKAVR